MHNNFGSGFLDHRDDDEMRKGAGYLGQFILDNPNVKAISSHHLTLPLPVNPQLFLPQIMLLRHPIERVTSVYNYERQQGVNGIANTPGAIYARENTLSQYVQWSLNSKTVINAIRNFQTAKCLPLRDNLKPFSVTEVKKSQQYLYSLELLGVIELFDESMVLMEDFLGRYIPDIDLSYLPMNVRQELQPINKRITELRSSIGESLYRSLILINKLDIGLYNYAKKIIQRRIGRVSNFEDKLVDFKRRCSLMQRT